MADNVVGSVTVEVKGSDANLTATLARDKAAVQQFDAQAAASMERVARYSGTSAKATAAAAALSAKAAKEQAKEMADLARRADQLRAAIDPLIAAEQRFAKAAMEADTLLAKGAITLAEHTAAMKQAQDAFSATEAKIVQSQSVASFRAMALGAAGMATAVGIAAAMLGVWGAAALAAEHNTNQATLATMGLGRAAGLNAESFHQLAASAADAADISIASARQMETIFLRAGVSNRDVLKSLIESTRSYAMVTGQELIPAAEELARYFTTGTAGAEALDAKLNLLDADTRRLIESMIAQNRTSEAQIALAGALGTSLDGVSDHVDSLAESWRKVKNAANDAWMAMQRAATLSSEEERSDLERRLGNYNNAPAWVRPLMHDQAWVDAANARVNQLRAEQARRDAATAATAGRARTQAQAKADQDLADRIDPIGAQRRALGNDRQALEGARGRMTPEQYARLKGELDQREAALQRRDDGPRGPRGRRGSNTVAEEQAALRAATEGNLALAAAYLESGEAAVKAEARRQAATRAARSGADVEEQYALQLAANVAERTAGASQQAAMMRDEAAAQKVANDAVAAGTMTSEQARRQMELEARLRPLLIDEAIAEGAAKERLKAVIDALRKSYADANREQDRAVILRSIEQQKQQNEQLKLQLSLIEASNRARAVAMAQLQAEQDLKNRGIDPASQTGRDYIAGAVANANAGADVNDAGFMAGARRSTAQDIAEARILSQTYGMTAQEAATFRREQELLNNAVQAGIELTPEQKAEIAALASAYGAAAESGRKFEEQINATREAADFMAESFAEGLEGIIFDSQDAGEALRKLVIEIARAAYQALALGKGPLAGIFGTSGNGTVGAGPGGWINDAASWVFGTPSGSGPGGGGGGSAGLLSVAGLFHDGTVNAGAPSQIRMVPTSATLTAPRFHTGLGPNEVLSILERGEGVISRRGMSAAKNGRGGGSDGSGGVMRVSIDLKGANGDAAIEAAVDRGVASALAIANAEGPARQSRFDLLGT